MKRALANVARWIALVVWFLALAAHLVSCSRAKSEPAQIDPPADVVETWDAAQDRLLSLFAPDGFVVSIDQDGQPRNQGDSLIFTGIALASMDCTRGERLAAALEKMLTGTSGQLYRHPTLPGAISLDGALGLYRGVAHRVIHCGEASRWAPLLQAHLALGGTLNKAAGLKLAAPFTYVRDLLAAKAGVAAEPAASVQAELETAVAAWAEGVKLTRSGCFRAHLGLQALQTIEALGGTVSGRGRDAFCAATDGLGLATTDNWCGRDGLKDWLASYVPNRWQFAFQRCPSYDAPDGAGMQQPGVDQLRGLADVYSFTF